MNPRSALVGPDAKNPYTGEPWDAPAHAPRLDGVVVAEAFAEPTSCRVSDPHGSGFAIGRITAPTFRCLRCGAQTTRTRLLECTTQDVGQGAGGTLRWVVPVEEAECPACAKQRAGVRS